jgi:hypothetical protein
MAILTGAQASYFWRGLATAMPTPTNTAPDAVVLAQQTDTADWFAWDGATWNLIQTPPTLRLTGSPSYELQYSLDGGATWTTITGWDTNLPLAVQHFAPKIEMVPGLIYPPIPSMASGGADYIYSPPYN